MTTSEADRFRKFLRRFPNEPSERMTAAVAAIDAFEVCERKAHIDADDLIPLVRAASSTHKLVFDPACNLLNMLARHRPEARQSILEMARDKNVTARFHAVAYLGRELPEDLRLDVIALALADRSAKVRQKAVERATEFKFKFV